MMPVLEDIDISVQENSNITLLKSSMRLLK